MNEAIVFLKKELSNLESDMNDTRSAERKAEMAIRVAAIRYVLIRLEDELEHQIDAMAREYNEAR